MADRLDELRELEVKLRAMGLTQSADHYAWAVARIEELEARHQEEWTRVEDRLPVERFVLLAGPMAGGRGYWRDAGVHLGNGDFRDKNGATTHPTHWRPLPAEPVPRAISKGGE